MPGRLGWTIARVPAKLSQVFGRGMVKVRGDINGFEFRTSLFPDGKGGHYILVNKQMQKGAAVAAGARAKFTLAPDTEERAITEPKEFTKVLSKRLRKFYESFSYSYRNYMAKWIAEPKSAAARERRAEQIAVRLMETMEAEKELPPAVAREFVAHPRAARGWKQMTAGMRRGELMGIFYYRDPESRARRIAKAVAAAEAYAERKGAE